MTLQFIETIPFFNIRFKKNTIEEKEHQKRLLFLHESLEDSKKKMNLAQENFGKVTEPKLIDFYIYKFKAEQSRYEQLLLEYRKEESSFIHSSL